MKVVFAIPTITGDFRCETAKSLMEAVLACKEMGIEVDMHIIANCPVLPVARNSLVAMFMADPDATDLFFLDYDVGFDPIAVIKLLKRPEPIVAGAYRVKVDDRTEFSVVPKQQDGVVVGKVISEDPPQALIAADFLATGFMRIKREVFDLMARAYPELKYKENVVKTVNRKIEEAYDFFGMGIDETRGRYTTEDYMFCKRWRDIGGELWIYPDIDFDHIGRKAYSGNFHQHLMGLDGGAKSSRVGIRKALEIEGWMTPQELTWLAAQAECHTNIAEIGSWKGRSTRALADNTKGTVRAVDTWQGSEEHEGIVPEDLYWQFQHSLEDLSNWIPMQMPSNEAAILCSAMGKHFDMVFIDASHDYENVKADIQAWKTLLQPGGLLCGHDYSWVGVKQAVTELLPDAKVVPGTDIWFSIV